MTVTVATPEQLEIVNDRAPSIGAMSSPGSSSPVRARPIAIPDENENWHSLTWAETGDRVTRLAAGLVSLGIQPEERVAIASGTRLEWILADLAIVAAGAATTTVYPSTMSDDVAYILADSDSRIVFAEDDEQVAKLREKHSELPSIIKVVVFEGTTDGDWVIGFDDLEKLGEQYLEQHPKVIEERVAATKPELARHPDLHVRHDRPAQGRTPEPRRLDLRRRGDARRRLPQRGRPAVPVAADGALVRQGAC